MSSQTKSPHVRTLAASTLHLSVRHASLHDGHTRHGHVTILKNAPAACQCPERDKSWEVCWNLQRAKELQQKWRF